MKPIFGFMIGAVLFLVMVVLFGAAVMLLWNALIPDIFGLAVITYWQALGLIILARVLFGGFGFSQGDRHKTGHLFVSRNALRKKWLNMSEEERQEFIKNGRGSHFFHREFDHDDSSQPDARNGSDDTGDHNE